LADQEQTVGTRNIVIYSLETIMDHKGNTLLGEAADKLQAIEDEIQQYLSDNLGNPPPKEFELCISVKVSAADEVSRIVDWTVGVKRPKLDKVHTQTGIFAQEGQMVVMDPQAFQAMLPLERGTSE